MHGVGGGLEGGVGHWWRVRVCDGGGDTSAFRAWGVHMGLLEAFRGGEAVMWWECSK